MPHLSPPDHVSDQRTLVLFGKPYYWVKVDGVLNLRPGISPSVKAQAEANGTWHTLAGELLAAGLTP